MRRNLIPLPVSLAAIDKKTISKPTTCQESTKFKPIKTHRPKDRHNQANPNLREERTE